MSSIVKKLTTLSLVGYRVATCNINSSVESGDDDRGFGQTYRWVKLEDAFEQARDEGKPIFLIIHKETCPACLALKEKFSRSFRILDLSRRFVMVNVENGVETSNNYDKYRPDGKYVPRILFFTPGGELIRDAFNRSSSADSEYRYFHKSPYSIVQTMNYVLKNYSTE